LERIGISPNERENRNITFHSWRHFFNTWCRASNIPDSKIQSVTGHRTIKMTVHYSHMDIQDIPEVKAAQEAVLAV
jgi:integrase